MKPPLDHGGDTELSRLLQTWKPDLAVPPSFNQSVWNQIARETPPITVSPWVLALDWLKAGFMKPAWAAAFMALMLATGAVSGYWQATQNRPVEVQVMSSQYLHTVNPYFHASASHP